MAHATQTDMGAAKTTLSQLEARKRQLTIQRLELCRDAIAQIDSAQKDSWKSIIDELLLGGFEIGELETELAASSNTIYKWRSGLTAPREMTRRLLHRAILEMIEERLKRVKEN